MPNNNKDSFTQMLINNYSQVIDGKTHRVPQHMRNPAGSDKFYSAKKKEDAKAWIKAGKNLADDAFADNVPDDIDSHGRVSWRSPFVDT